jgi:hypothetical protein
MTTYIVFCMVLVAHVNQDRSLTSAPTEDLGVLPLAGHPNVEISVFGVEAIAPSKSLDPWDSRQPAVHDIATVSRQNRVPVQEKPCRGLTERVNCGKLIIVAEKNFDWDRGIGALNVEANYREWVQPLRKEAPYVSFCLAMEQQANSTRRMGSNWEMDRSIHPRDREIGPANHTLPAKLRYR